MLIKTKMWTLLVKVEFLKGGNFQALMLGSLFRIIKNWIIV